MDADADRLVGIDSAAEQGGHALRINTEGLDGLGFMLPSGLKRSREFVGEFDKPATAVRGWKGLHVQDGAVNDCIHHRHEYLLPFIIRKMPVHNDERSTFRPVFCRS